MSGHPSRCSWYDQHWRSKETPDFESWWVAVYGTPESFGGDDENYPSEYYRRKGFALMGWLAARAVECKECGIRPGVDRGYCGKCT